MSEHDEVSEMFQTMRVNLIGRQMDRLQTAAGLPNLDEPNRRAFYDIVVNVGSDTIATLAELLTGLRLAADKDSAVKFFFDRAGYGYDPKIETPEQGRARDAQELAEAEARAKRAGLRFVWEVDPDIDSSHFSDEVPPWDQWQCTALCGGRVGYLGGVDFGRDGTPHGDAYARVVEAEIALEWFAERD
jgi:hypothetical protein